VVVLSLLCPDGIGRRIRRKKQNSWVGIKTLLTEQQREKKITRRILIKRICGVQFSDHAMLNSFLSSK